MDWTIAIFLKEESIPWTWRTFSKVSSPTEELYQFTASQTSQTTDPILQVKLAAPEKWWVGDDSAHFQAWTVRF